MCICYSQSKDLEDEPRKMSPVYLALPFCQKTSGCRPICFTYSLLFSSSVPTHACSHSWPSVHTKQASGLSEPVAIVKPRVTEKQLQLLLPQGSKVGWREPWKHPESLSTTSVAEPSQHCHEQSTAQQTKSASAHWWGWGLLGRTQGLEHFYWCVQTTAWIHCFNGLSWLHPAKAVGSWQHADVELSHFQEWLMEARQILAVGLWLTWKTKFRGLERLLKLWTKETVCSEVKENAPRQTSKHSQHLQIVLLCETLMVPCYPAIQIEMQLFIYDCLLLTTIRVIFW